MVTPIFWRLWGDELEKLLWELLWSEDICPDESSGALGDRKDPGSDELDPPGRFISWVPDDIRWWYPKRAGLRSRCYADDVPGGISRLSNFSGLGLLYMGPDA